MATQRTISRTVTVSTIEDGVSQPSYIQTQEAWSNIEVTASATTRPSDCANSVWKDYTPANTNNRAYLWRRSRTMTLNASTRTYTAGSWSYQRLSGTNGTSISVKGHVATVSALPTTHADGDAYVVDADRHLYLWSAESSQWLDLGEFKGESGKTYYTHIAFADTVTFTGTIPSAPEGQTTNPNASAVTGFTISPSASKAYMGVMVNETVADSTQGNLYTWNSVLGRSIEAQYSKYSNPASGDIHTSWQAGDLYMRTRPTGGTWSSWMKIVGESGDETDYSFNISSEKTSTNVSTPPQGCYYSTWQDAPVATRSTHPYLWMKMVRKTWNASTQSYDSAAAQYIRMTGEKTYTAIVELSRTTILYNANSENVSTGAQSFTVDYTLKAGSNTVSVSSSNVTISIPSGMTVVSKSATQATLRVDANSEVSGVVTVTITGSYDGQSLTASAGITVEGRRMGVQGQTGRMGRAYYYDGEWVSTKTYYLDDTQAPFVMASNGEFYMLSNAANNGDNVSSRGENPTYSQYSQGSPWTLMDSEHKYYIAEAIFAQFAKLGSAIFNKDWMHSQWGMKDGEVSTSYQSFSPSFLTTGWQTFINGSQNVTSTETVVGTFTCIAGESYTVLVKGRSGSTRLPLVVKVLYNSATVATVQISATTVTTQEGTFTAQYGGEYKLSLYTGSSVSATVNYLGIKASAPFIPNLAFDLLTGRAYLNDAIMGGFVYKKETVITDDNVGVYLSYESTQGGGVQMLDLRKTGSWVTFADFTGDVMIFLPSLTPGNRYEDDTVTIARSFVGQTLLIYNKSSVSIGITGNNRTSESGGAMSWNLASGQMAAFTCKVTTGANPAEAGSSYETIYWEYRRGTIFVNSTDNMN